MQRVLSVGVGGLLDRGRQEVSRTLERIALVTEGEKRSSHHLSGRSAALVKIGAASEAAQRGWDGFIRNGERRFFAGAWDDKTPENIARISPQTVDQVIASAEAVTAGRFNLLGYRDLSFGNPVDWHFDPLARKRAAFVHWSLIDPLDAGAIGDCKVIWELNRHQWLVTLGQAYRFTGNERYAHTAAGLIRDWMRQNAPGMGINWTSSLEVSLRLISWCWTLTLFHRSPAFAAALGTKMTAWIRIHALHVEKYLSRYFSPNTHLTGEALGLVYAGSLFREFPEARRWLRAGSQLLMSQLRCQVLDDGVYFEQSTCYQRYTAEIYLHYLLLCARNGRACAPLVAERVQSLLDFLVAVRRPDGSMPQIGDADGGQLLLLNHHSADDFSDVFAVAAAIFKRADYAWAAGRPVPEMIWLVGTPGWQRFDALKPAPPGGLPSRIYRVGGYAVMRNDWSPQAHQMVFDVGPLGCPLSGGHGHADLLSVQCSSFGETQLVDSGTCSYVRGAGWRDYFRSTFAHSTVTIDGQSQAEPTGEFSWNRLPRARLRRWISSEQFDFVDAEHDAYRRLADPVIHRRRVCFVKPRFWILVDDLVGDDVHRVDLRFQFAQQQLDELCKNRFVSRGSRGGLLVHAFSTNALDAVRYNGASNPIQGWISDDYGLREPAPSIVFTVTKKLPMRLVTFVVPVKMNGMTMPAIEMTDANENGWRFSLDRNNEFVCIDDVNISAWRHSQIGELSVCRAD